MAKFIQLDTNANDHLSLDRIINTDKIIQVIKNGPKIVFVFDNPQENFELSLGSQQQASGVFNKILKAINGNY